MLDREAGDVHGVLASIALVEPDLLAVFEVIHAGSYDVFAGGDAFLDRDASQIGQPSGKVGDVNYRFRVDADQIAQVRARAARLIIDERFVRFRRFRVSSRALIRVRERFAMREVSGRAASVPQGARR